MLMVDPSRRTLVKVEVADAEKRRLPSKHYSYVIKVGWSDDSETVIYRRYSKFFDFQIILLETFPYEGGLKDPSARIIPFLPGKILFRRSHVRDVAMKRLKPIDEYCKALVKLPSHISHCEHVLDFFETRQEDLNPIREDGSRRRRKEDQGSLVRSFRSVRRTKSLDIGEISGPMVLEPYLAVADYVSTQIKELSIGVGQKLEVIEKNENGWWFVSNDEGERGWVPGVYLEKPDGSVEDLITNRAEPGQGEHYVTTHEYIAENSEDISFGAGVIVEVLQKNLEGWWLVSLNGKQGNAPASYLEKSHDWVRESQSGISSHLQHRLSLPAENLASIGIPSQGILNKSSFRNLQPIPSQSDISDQGPRSPLSPTFREKTVQPPPKRSSVKKTNKMRPNAPPPLPPSITEESVYMTVASFTASISDGVSFEQEKKVEVLEKSPGGWWYVIIDGNEGWAPASYIEKRENIKPKALPPSRPGPPQLQKKNSANDIGSTFSSVLNPIANRKTQLGNTVSNPVHGSKASNSASKQDPNASPAKRPLPPIPTSASFSNSNDSHETYEEVGDSSNQRPVSECIKSDLSVMPALKSVNKPKPGNKVQNNEVSQPVDFRSVLKSNIAAKHNEIKTRSSRSPPRLPKGPNLNPSKTLQQTNANVPMKPSVTAIRKPIGVQKSDSKKENDNTANDFPKRPLKPAKIINGPPRLPPKPSSGKPKPISSLVTKDDDVVVDFRSVLKSTQRKQSSDVGRSSSFNSDRPAASKECDKPIKPPFVPKKPNNLPLKPKVPPKMPGTDEIPDGEENIPKLTSVRKPVTKPPWNSGGGAKPVLRRFQANNNSNAESVPKKPVFTVGHLKVELKKTPDLNISLPKRGSPDGQVDNKFEKSVEATVVPPQRMKKFSKNNEESQKPVPKLLHKKEKSSHVANDTQSVEYVAISDYAGLEESEISFKCGEKAQVIEKAENNWWYVKIDDRLGWAPSSYFLESENIEAATEKSYVSADGRQSSQYDSVYSEIESEEPLPTFPSNFVAAADFNAEDHSMISFSAGDEVTVTQEAGGGWWYAILSNGKGEGWAPSTYFDPV